MFNVVTLLLLVTTFSIAYGCNIEDLNTLLAFKNSFPANTLPTWKASTDCCSWDFVQCDSTTGRVVSLQLWGNVNPPSICVHLKGSIPESVGNLPFLRTLRFADQPGLVGTIPPQLTKLTDLRSLSISNPSISGPVPSFLGQLESLEALQLSESKFFGTIPPSLGNLVNLSTLDLSGNQLAGSIPSSLHSGLLYLSNNKLTGTIPPSFANVSTFSIVHLENNRLTGDASPFFGRTKTLSDIVLFNNQLSFDLSNVEYPEETLEYVDMSHNKIYGSISDRYCRPLACSTSTSATIDYAGRYPVKENSRIMTFGVPSTLRIASASAELPCSRANEGLIPQSMVLSCSSF